MTHNLPERIREHFAEQNQRHLAKKQKDIETIVIPLCPVYRHIKGNGVVMHDLSCYGLNSNSCMDCGGYDFTCEIYQDWYEKRHLRGEDEDI